MLPVARGGEWAGRQRRLVSSVTPRSRALCTNRFYGCHAHTNPVSAHNYSGDIAVVGVWNGTLVMHMGSTGFNNP